MIRPRFARTLAAAAALLTFTSLAVACSGSETTTTADGKTVLRYEGTTGQVSFPELAADLGYYQKVELNWIGDTTSGPQSIQNAATGQTDFGGAFNGAVLKLAAADSPITSVIGYYGSDKETFNGYYVLDGSPITSARDLIGKKVGMNTLGAHHEFLVREWLAREGLTPDEIKQVELTVVPPVNTEQALRQGQIDVGTLGSVFRDKAVERGGIRPLFTDESIFGSFTYGSLLFRDDFIAKNKDAVADFVQGTARAIRWTQTTPRDDVIAKYKDIITKRGRNETTDLVDYWKTPGVAGPGGVITDKEIQTWIDWLVRNGELEDGKLTPADVYTNEYNPYANGTYPADSGPDGQALAAK
ncbi:ABC transporter substrate-binding protein [Rhodococcus opacus]|uniref:ABC transporter substrate-binding protein n=1 Tax=Rhodococcus opacus TaxID=37919 RepID=A0AAX3YJW4_RHOOP|nr:MULTISPECIES: ABC transporter substrate-binding protein [Rhodococcus]ELB94231.1 sulfonate ABC transporter substrate-binding protein [Rhodococcus wratislaviensis IFP 2016]NHU45072.1 ABC transporter substrate-binding protein [Rhodococcus sp. A14]MCZ4585091.1 ABC transporter substrate-binding protein [Rhodococcus opacus]MDI9937315.1 ABC transporter substrate-binding protein [Rhodococcus sp. IEGM 1351]MDX5969448.1 ABC transporter substrate-binding protein [Rhodococcus opacus]